MAEIASGLDSSVKLTVDPVSKAARASLYDASGNAAAAAENDQPNTYAGLLGMAVNDRSILPIRADRMGSLASSLHNPLFTDTFEGSTINPIRWLSTATTMAATQSSTAGFLINSGAITTVSTGYMLQTAKRFMKTQRSPMHAKFRGRIVKFNNSVMELGFGDASTFNGAHTTGAFFQVTSSGTILPTVMFNGSVQSVGSDIAAVIDPTKYYVFDVFMDDDEALFIVQDTSTGLILNKQSLKVPLTAQRMWSASALPAMARVYNTGTAPSSAPQLFVTDVYIAALDAQQNKPWPHVLASMERGATASPFTGAQLAQWANSAEPASATLSNTAAGYTTLGGKFQFAAVAGAATDYALFGFQVPAPANLVITGVDIEAWNTGAAVATTPTLMTWGLAVGSTAVSLATATAMRVGLGAQDFAVAAAIGARAQRIQKSFQAPLFCASGRFVHVILRMPIGTATASQVIAGMVNFEGYFE